MWDAEQLATKVRRGNLSPGLQAAENYIFFDRSPPGILPEVLMNCWSARGVVISLAPLLFTSIASAQAADTTHTFSGSGDIGLVNAAGNTDVTTLNVGEALTYAPVKVLRLAQSIAIVYGRTNGVESASLWHGSLRGDRDLGNRWGTYALLEFDRNTFASIDRRFQEGIGALYHPIRSPTDTLGAELGVGLVEQRSTGDSSVTQPIGRIAGSYRHSFAPKAYGEELLEILPDLQQGRELRINSATNVVAPLFRNVALKASYVVNFDNAPQPGRRKADRFLTTGVQLSF
jgi:putative salt-induced outer membrane protein YdiY